MQPPLPTISQSAASIEANEKLSDFFLGYKNNKLGHIHLERFHGQHNWMWLKVTGFVCERHPFPTMFFYLFKGKPHHILQQSINTRKNVGNIYSSF